MAGRPFKRGKSWVAIVELAPDPATGARRQHWLTAPTRKEVEALQARAIAGRDDGVVVERADPTLAAQIASYLATDGLALRPRTRAIYAQGARLYVAPRIGAVRIKRVTPLLLTRWLADLKGAGLANNTILTAWGPVRNALGQAHRLGLLPRNPCDAVQAPADDSAERPALDAAQVRTLLDCLRGDRFEAAYLVALATALRFSEVLALRWSDLDPATGALAVARQQTEAGGGVRGYADAKSRAGRRVVALGPVALAALKAHRARQAEARLAAGAAWRDHDLIFCTPRGAALPPTTLRYHIGKMQRRWEAAGLPHLTFHDLRHQHATLGLRAGVHPQVMAKRLGHADPRITLDRYSHVVASDDEAAALAIDAFLAPPPDEGERRGAGD